MSMVIETAFDIGQTVYLKTDVLQTPRIVYGYYVDRTSILYRLIAGTDPSNHYDFEISETKNVLVE